MSLNSYMRCMHASILVAELESENSELMQVVIFVRKYIGRNRFPKGKIKKGGKVRISKS